MSQRPLTPEEREYLQHYKASLGDAFKALWLTVGFWAMPLGFVVFTLASSRTALSGDRVALFIAVAILVGLTGGMMSYTAKGKRVRPLRPSDIRLLSDLDEDILAREAKETTLTVKAKEAHTPRAKKRGTLGAVPARTYYIKADDRRFEISGPRWMALSPGDQLQVTFAARSGLLLEVDGQRERLPMPNGVRPVLRTYDDEPGEGPKSFQS